MRNLILPAVAAITLGGCSSVDYGVNGDAQLNNPQSFSFVEQDVQAQPAMTGRLIEQAINREMTEQGIEEASTPSSDLLVSYRFQNEQDIDPQGTSGGVAYGAGTGSTVMSVTTEPRDRDLKPAELVVEVREPGSQDVLWQASALMDINEDATDDQRKQVITDVVDQMFQNFPTN